MRRQSESLDLSPSGARTRPSSFKPVSHPARMFETPIQQLSTSRPVLTGTYIFPFQHTHLSCLAPGAFLAVRTFSYPSLLQCTGSASPTLIEVTRTRNAGTRDLFKPETTQMKPPGWTFSCKAEYIVRDTRLSHGALCVMEQPLVLSHLILSTLQSGCVMEQPLSPLSVGL